MYFLTKVATMRNKLYFSLAIKRIINYSLTSQKFVETNLLSFPSKLGRNNSESGLLPVGKDLSGLPPLVVRSICHVQDVTVGKGQATAG